MEHLSNLPNPVKIGLAVVSLLGVAGVSSVFVALAVLAVANSVFGVGLTVSTLLVVGAVLPLAWWLSFGVWRRALSTFWDE